MYKQRAFTIIELIVVIVVLGILAVSVAPKLAGNSGFSAFSLRDQLIGQLRLVQLRAMNDHLNCYQVTITATSYANYVDSGCDGGYAVSNIASPVTLPSNTTVSIAGVTNTTANRSISFDRLGRPTALINGVNTGSHCTANNQCLITVSADDSANICIEYEGYIHDC